MASDTLRARLAQAMNELDLRIHSNLAFDDIMQATLDGFVAALNADAGDIKLLENDEWSVRYETGFGTDVVGERLSAAEAPVAERVRVLGEPVVITDYLEEPTEFYVGFPLKHTLRAVVAVPLVIRQEVIGCLFAWMKHEPRSFTEAEVDFARRVATSVALALENARLYSAEQDARRRAEVAERELAAELERTSILLRASDELLPATDPDELLQRLASAVMDATGISRVFINLIDEQEQVLVPKVATGGLVAPGGDRIPFDRLSETSRNAIASKGATLLDYERPDLSELDRAIATANNARLVLFVPLVHQGAVVGHISLDEPGARYEFSAEDLRIVASIAAQAAVALSNTQLYAREHTIAETLQNALLEPPEPIEVLEVGYLYQAASKTASVGGDFYDVVDLGRGKAFLMIGDVAGKGIQAARLTTLVRDGVRAYALEDPEPSHVFARVNELAYRFTPPERFATAFIGVLDCPNRTLRYCGAGHPPPVITGPDGVRVLDAGQGLLGAFAHTSFTTQETHFVPDEVLCMYTDGVTEARNQGRMFGEEGVIAALGRLNHTSASELPAALLDEVLAFSDEGLKDDIVILCAAHLHSGP